MFYLFDDNVIKITRGNSADISITVTDAETGEPIELDEGDKVVFTAKNPAGVTVIRKELTSNDASEEDPTSLVMSLTPGDTMITTGEYKYDVLYLTHDNQAITFISSTLIILPAIGLYTDTGGVSG